MTILSRSNLKVLELCEDVKDWGLLVYVVPKQKGEA